MIRKATIEDSKDLANIHILGWRSAYRNLLPDEFLDSLSYDDREKNWRGWLEKELLDVYVYVENTKVLGYISIKQKESFVDLMGLYLLPQEKNVA